MSSETPPITVLVVEDNAINRELAVTILEAAGFIVLQAGDAETGVALAQRERPDVILMDVGLPGVDGLAATRMLKSDPRTEPIPVIAVSAHAMKADEARALASGCHGYITKPIDTRSLAAIVRRFAARAVSDRAAAAESSSESPSHPPRRP